MSEARTVLLVEDDRDLSAINRRALEMRGYRVLAALTLEQARIFLKCNRVEVILLDVMLPDGNGFDFCEEIREKTSAHILFLTSRAEHKSRVHGLLIGGDDYITKPYSLEEMLARVDAAMRRREMEAQATDLQIIAYGMLTLNTISNRAFYNDRDMGLTERQFLLLKLLVRKRGSASPKEELFEAAWSQPMAGDSNALLVQISRLKTKLEDFSDGQATICWTRGEGYSLEIR